MPAITVADHQRVYSDRTVDVTGGSLTTYDDGTAIAAADTAYVYYDDPARAGGAVSLKATKTAANAINGSSNPARHYIGAATIPATGSSGGVPAYPPGLATDI